jgi:S1-C subfamily serine protease
VAAYGYPVGGDRMSVTEGIVSRIDFQTYTHSLVDSHLAIQISAAINPGNSGGPVLQHGKVVGRGVPGIQRGRGPERGVHDPGAGDRPLPQGHLGRALRRVHGPLGRDFPLQNPAMRRALGLADDDRGVMVSKVAAEGCSDGVLKVGDVLMSIDGHEIASDGFTVLDGARVQMAEVVERKFKGDDVKLHIIRTGRRWM